MLGKVISTLTRDSLFACASLYVETFNGPPWNEAWTINDATRRLSDLLGTPQAHGITLSDSDGHLIGFALGHTERSVGEDHFLLKEMCVLTREQRHGYGSTLLAALAEQLPDVQKWYLLTARESTASAFYEKNGFRPAGRMGVFVRP